MLREYIGTQKSGWLWSGRNGDPIKQITRSAERVFDVAGITRPPRTGPFKTLRHTYATMRLQTTEQGKPISVWVVKDELGHGSLQMLERHYGHLMKNRQGQRGETVEYKPSAPKGAKAVGE